MVATDRGLRVQVIGPGRMGVAIDGALRAAGVEVLPIGARGADGAAASVVLLAVPDAEIANAAASIAPGRCVGHLSGITTLDALQTHEAFSVHPLMSVPVSGASFAGTHAAIDGSTTGALAVARDLAVRLGMIPFRVADEDRGAYHAAASIASNYLVTLEGFAEQLALSAGVPRAALLPLVEASLRNWAELGAESALTGPVARGDDETVEKQRRAVLDRCPESIELFDALTAATRVLAGGRS